MNWRNDGRGGKNRQQSAQSEVWFLRLVTRRSGRECRTPAASRASASPAILSCPYNANVRRLERLTLHHRGQGLYICRLENVSRRVARDPARSRSPDLAPWRKSVP